MCVIVVFSSSNAFELLIHVSFDCLWWFYKVFGDNCGRKARPAVEKTIFDCLDESGFCGAETCSMEKGDEVFLHFDVVVHIVELLCVWRGDVSHAVGSFVTISFSNELLLMEICGFPSSEYCCIIAVVI
jgi:hypothetical protein